MIIDLVVKERHFIKSLHYYPFFRRWVDKNNGKNYNIIEFEPTNFKKYKFNKYVKFSFSVISPFGVV
jgi:hypothetical protein